MIAEMGVRPSASIPDMVALGPGAATYRRERIPTAVESLIRPRFVPDSFYCLNQGPSPVALWYRRGGNRSSKAPFRTPDTRCLFPFLRQLLAVPAPAAPALPPSSGRPIP